MSSVQFIESRDQLDALLRSSAKLVVVDIYADWCGPCKQLTPRLEQLATAFASHSVVICKVNMEHVPMENINSVPTIQFWELKQGNRVLTKTIVGADAVGIQTTIETIVGGGTAQQPTQEEITSTRKPTARGRIYATFGTL